jgi:hypothetical protein
MSLSWNIAFAVLLALLSTLRTNRFGCLATGMCSLLLVVYVRRQSKTFALKNIMEGNDASRLGCTRMPKIYGRWPGNLDVLAHLIYSEARGYPSEIFVEWCTTYGLTFDMHILWSHQIFTGLSRQPSDRTEPDVESTAKLIPTWPEQSWPPISMLLRKAISGIRCAITFLVRVFSSPTGKLGEW